jgi:ClpP class serine protease
MGLMNEYIQRGLSSNDLEKELLLLIARYNKLRGTYLFVYSAAISKQIPAASLNMDDYYIMFDLLNSIKGRKLDFYIETPGGSGEAAEEIVRFVHKK